MLNATRDPGFARGAGGTSSRVACIAFALALGLGVSAVLAPSVGGGGPARGRRTSTRLPVAAQGLVSRVIGRDDPAYRVTAGDRGPTLVNRRQRLRAGFSSRGVSIRSGSDALSLTFDRYGYGDRLARVAATRPRADANRVSFDRGAVSEWYANGPVGLEQGFDLSAPPAGRGAGPLTIGLRLGGSLRARLRDGGVSFLGSDGSAVLRYGGLIVTDARGRRLRAWVALGRGSLSVRVDDRGASYPVRVDPFFQSARLTQAGGASNDVLGASVSASGDTVVARFRRANNGVVADASSRFDLRWGGSQAFIPHMRGRKKGSIACMSFIDACA